MATDNDTRTNVPTTQENQGSKEGQENVTGIDPAVLACQRRAFAGIRRAKGEQQ